MQTFVYAMNGAFVAQVTNSSPISFGFSKEEPWLLLHNTGRIDRFASVKDAKFEARKTWASCRFSKT